MGYFRDGPISLSMKQVFEIHYGLKVMMGGTPTSEGTVRSSSTLAATVPYQFRLSQYQICANKNAISRILWI